MNTKNKLAEHKKNDVASLFFVLKKCKRLFSKKDTSNNQQHQKPHKRATFRGERPRPTEVRGLQLNQNKSNSDK